LIPIASDIAMAKDAARRTLHCAKCGEKLTDSIQEKTVSAVNAIKGAIKNNPLASAGERSQDRSQFCGTCGKAFAVDAKFCIGCGGART
jgi:hypothetical protein